MPAHTGRRPGKLLDVRNLRAEQRRIGRVGHRANRVEQAGLEPAAPILKAPVRGVVRVGKHGSGQHRARAARFDGRRGFS